MNQIYCSNCGQLIPGNSNFCKFCGVPQHGPEARAYHALAPEADSAEAAKAAKPLKKVELFPRQTLGVDALGYFFLKYLGKTIWLPVLLLVGAIFIPVLFFALVAYFVAILIGATLTYNNFFFEVDETGLQIESGVIHKSSVSLPFEQIQNVNIERTLADRVLGLSKLSIETAGAVSGTQTNGGGSINGKVKAEAFLPGLNLEKAKKLHDLLIDGSDGVLGDD